MESTNSFGTILRRVRKNANISQESLAIEVSLTGSMISKYESKSKNLVPPKTKAYIIVEALAKLGAKESDLVEIKQTVENLPGMLSTDQYNHVIVPQINHRLERKSKEEADFIAYLLSNTFQVGEQLWEAQNKKDNQKWKDAPVIADKAIDHMNSTVVAKTNSFADDIRAESHRFSGDYRKAVHYYKRRISDLEEQDQGEYLVGLAICQRKLGELKDAEDCLKRACKILENDPKMSSESQRKLIGIYIQRTKIDDALELSEIALQSAPVGSMLIKAKIQRHKAWALSLIGDWDEAIKLYEMANSNIEEHYKKMNNKELTIVEEIKSARYLADVYILRKDWEDNAERLYRKALDLLGYSKIDDVEKIKYKLLLGMNLRGLGKVLVNKEGWEREAETYLTDSEKLSINLGEPLAEGIVSIDIGRLYAKRGRIQLAYNKLLSALDQLLRLENRFYVGECLVAICETSYSYDSASSMNTDDKYSVIKDIFDKYRGGAIKQNGELLFDLHYSKILSYIGLVRVDQGALSKGIEHLCLSTSRGLAYNNYVFEERVDDLLVAAKNLTRENKLEDAKTVCEKFIEYWNGQKTIDKNQESEVRKAVLRVRKSLEETDLLLAGQLKGKQK